MIDSVVSCLECQKKGDAMNYKNFVFTTAACFIVTGFFLLCVTDRDPALIGTKECRVERRCVETATGVILTGSIPTPYKYCKSYECVNRCYRLGRNHADDEILTDDVIKCP